MVILTFGTEFMNLHRKHAGRPALQHHLLFAFWFVNFEGSPPDDPFVTRPFAMSSLQNYYTHEFTGGTFDIGVFRTASSLETRIENLSLEFRKAIRIETPRIKSKCICIETRPEGVQLETTFQEEFSWNFGAQKLDQKSN